MFFTKREMNIFDQKLQKFKTCFLFSKYFRIISKARNDVCEARNNILMSEIHSQTHWDHYLGMPEPSER